MVKIVEEKNASAELQELVDAQSHHTFEEVCAFLTQGGGKKLAEVINDVHGKDPTHTRLMVDNGSVSINCPPPPEAGDSHGGLLLRSISDRILHDEAGEERITLSREFKVHVVGAGEGGKQKIEIRCDTTSPSDDNPEKHVIKEDRVIVELNLNQ
jgi:hypothetical protein